MSASPAYAATPIGSVAQISTANAARDGTGTITDIVAAGANGARIDDISIVAAATTTAGVIRFFLSNGVSTRLLKEILVSAVTPSATAVVWSQALSNLGWVLPPTWVLKASTHNAEAFNVLVTRGGNL
jgi:protein required for attachment to host cells